MSTTIIKKIIDLAPISLTLFQTAFLAAKAFEIRFVSLVYYPDRTEISHINRGVKLVFHKKAIKN